MTGRELYEAQMGVAADAFGVDLPPWESLTAWRRMMWNRTAAEYSREAPARRRT